ncbi:WD repeat-containing protein RUP2 [Ricinus communis]|uniref:Ubiquitin ligase protein cop1, putative n=1 Tax=Ricinus communis TaxID=3988 RepID=B9SS39_RICCO|nr:WD repeat-containing protein RUP2 [Ricinus communis]EEF33581.1 ubiquitin ligase protein cop1, putative [Ricinus communis]|eukprot:XP_002528808.3 WD repeat-containing protein RUP2 [Ricinus communis]
MGTFRWFKRRKPCKIHAYARYPGWAMKNFSDDQIHHPANRIEAPEAAKQLQESQARQEKQPEEEEEEERARCEWGFSLKTVVSSSSSSTSGGGAVSPDALGVIEFDQSENIVATGGIARKIRIYSIKSLLPQEQQHENGNDIALMDHVNACEFFICTPAKLSSLRWKPCSGGRVIGSGDYDGVVMEYDVETRIPIFERDEHGGRRIWSVDYSHWSPVVGASGSDDGTMQMWDPRHEGGGCVATVKPSVTSSCRAVCSVEFNPFGGSIIAVGCADRRVYGYDVRMITNPVFVLDGHKKTVTYVRFMDNGTLASAGIDGCLKLWNLQDSQLLRTYKGHLNSRNFVGLSVWRNGGLLGCGSENNQVFVYDKRWSEPIWAYGSGPAADHGFVNSVCWSQVGEDRCTLVTGGSNGVLQVFEGKRKPCIITS